MIPPETIALIRERTNLVAVIQDERIARKILEHLRLPARAPPRGRPWRLVQQLALDDPDRYDGVDDPALN